MTERVDYPNGGTSLFFANSTDMVIIDDHICDLKAGKPVFPYTLITDKQNLYMHQYRRLYRFLGYDRAQTDRFLASGRDKRPETADNQSHVADRADSADASPLEMKFEENGIYYHHPQMKEGLAKYYEGM